jgi:tripartite-type tricarboxylate transporter receptor subunit TctC
MARMANINLLHARRFPTMHGLRQGRFGDAARNPTARPNSQDITMIAIPRPAFARLLAQAALALAAVAGASAVLGQPAGKPLDWPKGPITFVAPFSPGGGGDTLARLFANEFAKTLGATVIVENRAGAGGNIGTAFVAHAAPDGNTLVFGTMGTMGTNQALYRKTGYSIADFEPVAMFGSTALVLVVGQDSPFHSVADLLAWGKQHPGKLSCASGGNGTVSHLACASLQQMTGIEVNHVPYKAASAAYIDMISDRVSFMIDVLPPLAAQVKGGKLRALAVSVKQRIATLPDTPTIAETVPGYELFSWDGLFAPRGTPAARLDKLHDAVNTALANPEFRQAMTGRGYTLATMSRKDFADFVRKEHVRMGSVVHKLGITLD